MKIPLFKPSITQAEIDEVVDTLKNGWISVGPKTAKFEKEFAHYVGSKYAVATNSCTSALEIALQSVLDGRKEVITTPMTFVSTPHIIVHLNKIPIFADVEWASVNISPKSIREKTTPLALGVIPVHYGGNPCDMEKIGKIAKENTLSIIEDCAHAAGSEYRGEKIGSKNVCCFSFHAVKNMTTGDGGMITLDDEELYIKIKKLRWLGISSSTHERDIKKYQWNYSVDYFGIKGNMNDIAASLGLVQLKRLDSMNAKRRKIAEKYTKSFEDQKWIEVPKENPHGKSSWHFYPIKVKERERLRIYLGDKGISTGVHYLPMFLHKTYRSSPKNWPVASKVWKHLLSLPMYPDMTDEELEYVIQTIFKFPKVRK